MIDERALEKIPGELKEAKQRISALERQSRPAPVVAVYQTDAGQSFANGVGSTIDYEDQLLDTHGAVTTGASWVFTAPIAGYYVAHASALLNTSNTWAIAEVMRLDLLMAGSVVARCIGSPFDSSASSAYKGAWLSHIGYLTAGQTIYAQVFQNSGGSLALYTTATFNRIAIARLG